MNIIGVFSGFESRLGLSWVYGGRGWWDAGLGLGEGLVRLRFTFRGGVGGTLV